MNIKKTLTLSLLGIIFFFAINRMFFFKHTILETSASYLTYPALWASNAVAHNLTTLFEKKDLEKEVGFYCKYLQEEREALLKKIIELEASLNFANKSKELTEFRERYNLPNAILASVMIKTFSDQEHSFIINKGTEHGVKENMAAIYKFQLIGRVSEVQPWYSKITLITDKHSKVSAYTNTTNALGVVEGSNNGSHCQLRYISHLANVQNDDLVLSSGQGLIFPEGFCLGKIVDLKTNDVCHSIEIEPLLALSDIQMCLLTNYEKMNLF